MQGLNEILAPFLLLVRGNDDIDPPVACCEPNAQPEADDGEVDGEEGGKKEPTDDSSDVEREASELGLSFALFERLIATLALLLFNELAGLQAQLAALHLLLY